MHGCPSDITRKLFEVICSDLEQVKDCASVTDRQGAIDMISSHRD